MNAPQELLKQYVQSQHFTSTADIMAAMKEMGCEELDWFIKECLPAFSLNLDQL